MKYVRIKTLEYVEKEIEKLGEAAFDEFNLEGQICYAIHTCWWCLLKHHPGYNKLGLPCDPRGSMLMQAPAAKFLANAKSNPEHYGKFKMLTFMAAYHGNITTDDGKPTSLDNWDAYNQLIEESLR